MTPRKYCWVYRHRSCFACELATPRELVDLMMEYDEIRRVSRYVYEVTTEDGKILRRFTLGKKG